MRKRRASSEKRTQPCEIGIATGPGRFRWGLALIAVSLSSCGRYGEIEAGKDPTSMMLMHGGALSPDGQVAAFSRRDTLCFWDATSRALRYSNLPTSDYDSWGVDSRQFVMFPWGSGRTQNKELLFINVADLSIQERLTLPFRPGSHCFFDAGVVGSCPLIRKWDEPSPVTLFRVENDRLVATGTLNHPGGAYNVLSAAPITNEVGLFLMRLLPDAGRTQASASSRTRPLGTSSRDAQERDDENRKHNIEACVFNVRSGRLVHRLASPAPPHGPWYRVYAARDGKRAVFLSEDTIEIRELPFLGLSARLNIKGRYRPEDDYAFSIAASHDARYVAFGSDRLELWDSRTMQVRTLDAMRSSIVRGKDDYIFPGSDFSCVDGCLQYCLADIKFMDDSSRFAVLTRDGVYAVWDAESGVCLRRDHIANVIYMAKDAFYRWHPSRWCFGFFVVYSVAALSWWVARYRRSLIPPRLSARSVCVLTALCAIGLLIAMAAYLLRGQVGIWQPSHAYVFVFPAYTIVALSGWFAWYRRSLMRLQFSLGSIFVLVTLIAIGLSILMPAFR
jgi:hypothetical protein